LLLRKGSQVTIAGHTEYFDAFFLDRISQRTNTQAARIFCAKVFVNDDDGKVKFHSDSMGGMQTAYHY
jgi:hypothetical protein